MEDREDRARSDTVHMAATAPDLRSDSRSGSVVQPGTVKKSKVKNALLITVLLIVPGGWLVLIGWAFVWAVRTGDELSAYSKRSYKEFLRSQRREEVVNERARHREQSV